MIKNVTKKVSRNKLTIIVETQVKRFFVNPSKVLTDDDVYAIACEEHDVVELLERPEYQVGNYINTSTKQIGEWIFKIKNTTKNTSTKSSIRGRISKIAKKRNEDETEEE